MSVKDTDLLQGPVPEQWKPENQDPSVAYTVDEMTGIRTPLVIGEPEEPVAEPEAVVAEPEPEPEPVAEEVPAEPEPEDLTEPEDPEAEKES